MSVMSREYIDLAASAFNKQLAQVPSGAVVLNQIGLIYLKVL